MQSLDVSQPPTAPTIIKIHDGVTFEAAPAGLRAWTNRKASTPLASEPFTPDNDNVPIPTAMSLDASCDILRLGVGFSDSSFRCYEYSDASGFAQYCAPQHCLDQHEPVVALAMNFPYVFALVGNSNFLLKQLYPKNSPQSEAWEEIAWLQAGRRHACIPSLTLRRFEGEVAASIAYTFELVGGTSWCLGIQELRASHSSNNSPKKRFSSGNDTTHRKTMGWVLRTFDAWTPAFPLHPAVDSRPKALSYSHPYLLAALPDNTMMVYLVTSTFDRLSLSDGSRLWGHTSGISSSEVNGRGKAVTTSIKGGEVRVWDLEGLARGQWQSKTSTPLVPTPDSTAVSRYSVVSAKESPEDDQLAFTKSWIAFDDEQVLVLGERRHERTLERYDFTR